MSIALRRFSDDAAWMNAILACFEEALRAAIGRGQKAFHASLAGGSTPEPVYRAFAASASLSALSADILVHLWVGDERDVEATSPLRNGLMISGIFSERSASATMPWKRPPLLHLWPEGDRMAACVAYALEIEDNLGPQPAFDIAILGMGADGHTAGLFSLADVAKSSVDEAGFPESTTLATVSPSEPRLRMTMAAGLIRHSRSAVVLVRGKEKADTLDALMRGAQYPLSAVLNPGATIFYREG